MRPVSHHPLSVRETKCSPSGATRIAENPPNSRWEDFNSSPPRYSTMPKRRWSTARALNVAIDFASTAMGAGGSMRVRWASADVAMATAAQATIAMVKRRLDERRSSGRRAVAPRSCARCGPVCLGQFPVTREVGGAATRPPYPPPLAEEGRVGASASHQKARRAFRSSRRRALPHRRS
jgi:hypothetical protein